LRVVGEWATQIFDNFLSFYGVYTKAAFFKEWTTIVLQYLSGFYWPLVNILSAFLQMTFVPYFRINAFSFQVQRFYRQYGPLNFKTSLSFYGCILLYILFQTLFAASYYECRLSPRHCKLGVVHSSSNQSPRFSEN